MIQIEWYLDRKKLRMSGKIPPRCEFCRVQSFAQQTLAQFPAKDRFSPEVLEGILKWWKFRDCSERRKARAADNTRSRMLCCRFRSALGKLQCSDQKPDG